MKVALVCVAKDEEHYINEWIEYHKKLGFNHIYIYENDWRSQINLPYVTTIQFNGKIKQLNSYNHFIKTNKEKYDYVAFFDCDEFLVLKKHNNIQDFLSEYTPKNGIGINWQIYGSGGKLIRTENSLIKQFIKRQNGINKHVKTILNLKSNGVMVNPHHPNIPLIDTNKKVFSGPFNPKGDDNVAVLNHYYHKTLEDWRIKINRGRADSKDKIPLNDWEISKTKYCETEDLTALNFMYKN